MWVSWNSWKLMRFRWDKDIDENIFKIIGNLFWNFWQKRFEWPKSEREIFLYKRFSKSQERLFSKWTFDRKSKRSKNYRSNNRQVKIELKETWSDFIFYGAYFDKGRSFICRKIVFLWRENDFLNNMRFYQIIWKVKDGWIVCKLELIGS